MVISNSSNLPTRIDPSLLVKAHLDAHVSSLKSLDSIIIDKTITLARKISKCLSEGGALFVAGNGGSSLDSQHLVAELVGRYTFDRKPLRAFSLNSDTSVLTCIANDFNYESIFSRQLQAAATPKDFFMAISTSGSSPNIRKAIDFARQARIPFALLTSIQDTSSQSGDLVIRVPTSVTAHIQEIHITIIHILCSLIEQDLFAENCQ